MAVLVREMNNGAGAAGLCEGTQPWFLPHPTGPPKTVSVSEIISNSSSGTMAKVSGVTKDSS